MFVIYYSGVLLERRASEQERSEWEEGQEEGRTTWCVETDASLPTGAAVLMAPSTS